MDTNKRVNHMTLKVTLTLSLRSRVIGSAHGLTERNIWVKLNKNRLKGSGGKERTGNSMVNH